MMIMDDSIASTTRPSEEVSVQVFSDYKLSASNETSMLTGVREYFKLKDVTGSRFWDFHPFRTLFTKTEAFCKSLSHLDSADEVFKHLFAYYFSHVLPITQTDRISQQYLHVKIVRSSPSLEEMITMYLPQLYEDRLAKIRTEVDQYGGDIFLAFTTEEIELGDLITLRKRTSKNKIQFGHFLFIIVGFICPKRQTKPPKKYLLKSVRLLEHQGDIISDDLFEDIFMDTLKLLWPNGNHLSQAFAHLKYIIADGDLLFDDLFRNLGNQYTELSRLVFAQNAHLLMHSIESDIRKNHHLACKVIDVVRMQWAISETFRAKYMRFSSETAIPPESFYRSASFYSANFSEAQRGILFWRSFRFDETNVSSTLSNPQFRPEFDKLAKSSSALLETIELASTVDVHLLSIQVADLYHEFLHFYRELHHNNDEDSFQEYEDWYVKNVQQEIGGAKAEKVILACGKYQLLKRLFEKLLNRSLRTAPLSNSRFAKYFMMKCVHTETFCIPATIEQALQPLEPLISSQLRRSFPRFWFLFKKYEVPLPWSVMNECSLVYSWAEANDHWTLDPNELKKIVL